MYNASCSMPERERERPLLLQIWANDPYHILHLLSMLRAEAQDKFALTAAGGDVRGGVKSVEQRRGEMLARQR